MNIYIIHGYPPKGSLFSFNGTSEGGLLFMLALPLFSSLIYVISKREGERHLSFLINFSE